MSKVKYRPSLTEQDINNCIDALRETNKYPDTLKTLRLYAMKIEMEAVTPLRPVANSSKATPVITEEEEFNQANDQLHIDLETKGYVFKSEKFKHLNAPDAFNADDL